MAAPLIVFLGPSLPLREARRVLKADYRPPARQGDIFRALVDRPRVIALIDGVFEGQPPVWHHELRAALASGVTVLGASSMGALRAAELAGEGMRGVGEIARRYTSGEWVDDADVALLHADAEHGFRPLTVPLVNVRATAEAAVRARRLTRKEAAALVTGAAAVFFQDRRWPEVLRQWDCADTTRRRFEAWLKTGQVDLKARDAVACLKAAARVTHAGPEPVPFTASSFVRRRRLMDAHGAVLTKLERVPKREALARDGTRRLLLAHLARAAGLTVEAADLRARVKSLSHLLLAPDEVATLAETLLLEERVLSHPAHFVSDGPSLLEGLALEAQLRGAWPRATQ